MLEWFHFILFSEEKKKKKTWQEKVTLMMAFRYGKMGQNFLTRPKKYMIRTLFFLPEAKRG